MDKDTRRDRREQQVYQHRIDQQCQEEKTLWAEEGGRWLYSQHPRRYHRLTDYTLGSDPIRILPHLAWSQIIRPSITWRVDLLTDFDQEARRNMESLAMMGATNLLEKACSESMRRTDYHDFRAHLTRGVLSQVEIEGDIHGALKDFYERFSAHSVTEEELPRKDLIHNVIRILMRGTGRSDPAQEGYYADVLTYVLNAYAVRDWNTDYPDASRE